MFSSLDAFKVLSLERILQFLKFIQDFTFSLSLRKIQTSSTHCKMFSVHVFYTYFFTTHYCHFGNKSSLKEKPICVCHLISWDQINTIIMAGGSRSAEHSGAFRSIHRTRSIFHQVHPLCSDHIYIFNNITSVRLELVF